MLARRAAALLLAATILAPPRAAAQDPLAEIGALLDRRAEAMVEGDLEAFLATAEPADPGFALRQRRLFEGFQRLGLASYELRLTESLWPELTTDREVARYGPSVDPRILHVEERYRLEGYDREPALEDLFLTFIRRGQEWLVTSDTDLDDVTLYSGRKLWELGSIVTRESEHFLYVSQPDQADAAARILEASERALNRVGDRWPVPWPERVPILAPSTTEELGRMIQATFDLDVFVAFAASGVDRATDWDLVGHRIMLNRSTFEGRSPSSNEEILTHELLHIATREDAGPMTSIFVEEGVAEWVTGGASTSLLASAVRSGDFDRRLPLDHEFTAGSGTEIVTAYQESSTAITFAADAYGDRAISAFYRTLGEPRRDAGTWRYHTDRAMRQAFGVGYRRFEKAWAGWVEEELG